MVVVGDGGNGNDIYYLHAAAAAAAIAIYLLENKGREKIRSGKMMNVKGNT